ncbi:MAG: hypothetical protein KTR31_27480 [Myxococcales bacterium]|nr:hypothetical protein [Myxococcales bacterium]
MAQGAHCRLRLTDGTERAAWVPKDALKGVSGGYGNTAVPMPTDGGPAFGALCPEIVEWFAANAHRPRTPAGPQRIARPAPATPAPRPRRMASSLSEAPTRKLERSAFRQAVMADAAQHGSMLTYGNPMETRDDLELDFDIEGFDAEITGDSTLSGTMAVPSSAADDRSSSLVQLVMAIILGGAFLVGLGLLLLAMAV